MPGFIDPHLHIESSKLLLDEFARLVLPLGTTAIVADPHEIANVLGTDGVHWLLDAAAGLPLDVYFMASSCVPASSFESPRRELTTGDLEGLLRRTHVLGLAEMMNFPGVVSGSDSELAKLGLARHIDGHAPGLSGHALNAYAAAGIESDHEAATVEEGRERLRAGLWLLIREASSARNLRALLPLVAEYGPHRMAFCTDDREPEHIADDGHINAIVRDAVAMGASPEDAIVMASLNPAVYHGLTHLGAIAPGRRADILVLPDLESFVPDLVLKRGRPVVEIPPTEVPEWVKRTVHVGPIEAGDLAVPWTRREGARDRARAGPDHHRRARGRAHGRRTGSRSPTRRATWRRSPSSSAISRPAASASASSAGFGLKRGAVGSTVAHDAHNMTIVGADDDSMLTAARRLRDLGGGLVVTDGDRVLAELPLPVAGLLSDRSLADVLDASRELAGAVRALGVTFPQPVQMLAFLSLSVIPSLKITDRGLVDVERFELVPLAV